MNGAQTFAELNATHAKAQADFIAFLQSVGFWVEDLTYHTNMDKKVAALVALDHSPTSLLVTNRPDGYAIHPIYDLAFEFEIKTHQDGVVSEGPDVEIEALPLLQRAMESQCGTKCLYVCQHNGVDFGFWVDAMPEFRSAMYPPKKRHMWVMREKLIPLIEEYLKPTWGVQAQPNAVCAGSGDPFIIVSKSVWSKLPHWVTLVANAISASPERRPF
jgi:hypothetical protein